MGCIRVSENAIWFNEYPSNISKTDVYSLQGVLANLARDLFKLFMHLVEMVGTFEISTIGF